METYSLAVCPHDTVRNSEGWYRLVQYLSGHLNANVHFTLALDFADFHERFATSDLVYANPSDTLKLVDQHGYTPLVRVVGRYDEAVLVAGAEGPKPALTNLAGAKLATISEQLPTVLALRMLSTQGVTPGELLNRPTWLSVVQAVWSGDAPYGILAYDAYADLSPQGQAMVQLITTTSEHCAFHTFCVGPKLAAQAETLRQLLLAMGGNDQGKEVLADLSITGWEAVSDAEVATMRGVMN